jgi:uncharacterized protein (DUF3820 family)
MIKNEYSYTKLPWGKYKGVYMKDIPDDYLLWAANNWQDPGITLMFKVELAHRKVNWQELESQAKSKSKVESESTLRIKSLVKQLPK